jgi:hypothetical protein
MIGKWVTGTTRLPGLRWVMVGLLIAAVQAQAPSTTTAPAARTSVRPARIIVPRSQNAEMYIRRRWGIDTVSVRSLSSGASIEFRYRVVDPIKAAVLNDSKVAPALTDQANGQKLSVPQMENVGTLRQVATPVAGKEYWMIFQDPHRQVKPGDRVDIAVGVLRLTGLTVE